MPRLPDEREMLEFVRSTLNETKLREAPSTSRFFFRDRFLHTLRVVGWVKRLCATEQCDERLTVMAAIFHDSGYDERSRDEHPIMSERICRSYMNQHGFAAFDTDYVCSMVRQHSFKKRPADGLSMELRVLMDADLLDELGLTIIMWDAMDEGHKNQGGYYSVLERVKQAYTRLKKLLPTLKTDTGRAEYEKGLKTLESAIERLEYELNTDFVMDFWHTDRLNNVEAIARTN